MHDIQLQNIHALIEQYDAIIIDHSVLKLYPSQFQHPLTFAVPGEEHSKSREFKAKIEDWLLAHHLTRQARVLVIGGGVVLDLGGFVMATYHRQTPWDAMPTTLLAMVDASIGGKVAVNTASGKNLIGAFHPPQTTYLCTAFLKTLPEIQLRSGIGEMIKHLLLSKPQKLAHYSHIPDWLTHPAIVESRMIKEQFVRGDLFDLTSRARLNSGHTYAHALEQYCNYQIPHGHAVCLGLLIEGQILHQKNEIDSNIFSQLKKTISSLALPQISLPDIHELYSLMQQDKKNQNNRVCIANWNPKGPDLISTSRPEWQQAMIVFKETMCQSPL